MTRSVGHRPRRRRRRPRPARRRGSGRSSSGRSRVHTATVIADGPVDGPGAAGHRCATSPRSAGGPIGVGAGLDEQPSRRVRRRHDDHAMPVREEPRRDRPSSVDVDRDRQSAASTSSTTVAGAGGTAWEASGRRHDRAASATVKDATPSRRTGSSTRHRSRRWPPLRRRPALDAPRADLLLRRPRPEGALQAGVPRRRLGRHPAAGRGPDVHGPVQPPRRRRGRRRPSYFAFALLGFGVWTYFSATLQTGTGSLLYNAELLTKVAFPRIVAPTADVPARVDRPRRRPPSSRSSSRWRPAAAVACRPCSSVCRSASCCSSLAVAGPVLLPQRVGREVPRRRRRSSAFARASCCCSSARSPIRRSSCREAGARCSTSTRSAGALGLLRWALVDTERRRRRRSCCCRSVVARRPAARRPRPLPAQRARVRGHHLMAATVIELDGVGKRYRLGEHHGTGPTCARRWPASPRRAARRAAGARCASSGRSATSSFTVDEGEALGIIGSQRRRQEHAAEGHQQHHDADRGR